MSDVLELINEVRQAGATLRAEPPDLVISPPGRVPQELKARLCERKADIIRELGLKTELEASMRRLEAADIRVAIFTSEADAGLRVTDRRIRTDAEAKQAVIEGGVIYSPADIYHYIQLEPCERRMLHAFKKRFGGTTEWLSEPKKSSE
jgi:hypothetical protein